LEQLSALPSVAYIDISKIHPNPDQPRKHFSAEKLSELAESIRLKGVIQPLLVEDRGDGHYTIVAGERRYRAAQQAGVQELPVIPQDLSEEERREITLIENIQREDLTPIEEARAFRALMDAADLGQEELAQRLGKNRSTIANSLRLLKLPEEVQTALESGELTSGHARALLSLSDQAQMLELFRELVHEGLTVREAERRVKDLSQGRGSVETRQPTDEAAAGRESVDRDGAGDDWDGDGREGSRTKSAELRALEQFLIENLGTKVVIKGSDKKGKIEISYFSTEDLNRISESLGRID
jgi:ParB family chromosome partitioning protein